MKCFLTGVILIIVQQLIIAQNHQFQNFTAENGLPSNQVYDIYQDVSGYIWFATDCGICKYNGYEFKIFDTSNGLTDNVVFAFFPQKDGSIWCSTFNNKLFYFSPKDYKFIPYKHNNLLARKAGNRVIGNILVENEMLYIGYKNEVDYFEIDKNGNVKSSIRTALYYSGKKNSDKQLKYAIYRKINNEGFSYIADSLGLKRLKASDTDFSELPISVEAYNVVINKITNDQIAITGKNFVKILEGNRLIKTLDKGLRPLNVEKIDDSTFYIAYHGGGFEIYNQKFQRIDIFFNSKSGTCLLKDHEGGTWFSTLYSGVYYLKPTAITKYPTDVDAKISGIAIDSSGQLWFSELKELANLYQLKNKESIKWKSFSTREIYPVSYYENYLDMSWFSIQAVKIGNDTTAVTLRNGLRFDVSQKEFIKYKRNNFNIHNPLVGERVSDVEKVGNKYIIAGANQVYYFENGKSTPVPSKFQQKINDIELHKGVEIYASANEGVIIKDKNQLFSITKADGLSSNYINRTYSDGDSILWVLSNNGIDQLYLKDQRATVKSSIDLKGYDALDIERVGDTIWFTTIKGVYSFNANLFDKKKSQNLNLDWVGISVNSKNVEQIGKLEYDQNNLNFQFQAISFKHHKSIIYRYKLLPNQTQWNTTQNLNLSFPELPPGNYELVVQASIDNENWEQIIKKFIIKSPYYQTWWFRVVIFLFLGSLIYWFFKVRILSYNKDVVREFFRLLNKRLKRNEKALIIRENGSDIKINSQDILFAKAADNYVEIHTAKKIHVTRMKIGDFMKAVPDPLEYIRIHRSYIVRIDQIQSKSKDSVSINGTELKVSNKYLDQLLKVQF